MLSGESDDELQHVWLDGGRETFARSIADKQSMAAAAAKTEVRSASLVSFAAPAFCASMRS